ncbi:MAG: DUF3524 domain-containing protein, partial [Desulfobacteraceae bacterium]|nr:DUF3524 domain-containing protein [Desulfobacteraceae bacterium]
QKPDKKKGQKNDLQYGYTNMTSALVATKIFFNSKFQFDEFILKLDQLIKVAPDFKPQWIKNEIIEKSKILYPGCRFSKPGIKPNIKTDIITGKPEPLNKEAPLIIWNHRWEWDKNPDDFFWALRELKKRKISFKLALLGEKYGKIPVSFEKAEHEFLDEIIAFGYVNSKKEYLSLLREGSIVVSTSIQENFGISVIEAVRMGCIPLLPNRLSYPEVMPEKHLDEILYSDKTELVKKLERMLLNYQDYIGLREQLSSYMRKYSWEILIKEYDMEFEKLVEESV